MTSMGLLFFSACVVLLSLAAPSAATSSEDDGWKMARRFHGFRYELSFPLGSAQSAGPTNGSALLSAASAIPGDSAGGFAIRASLDPTTAASQSAASEIPGDSAGGDHVGSEGEEEPMTDENEFLFC